MQQPNLAERVKQFLTWRALAYRRVFNVESADVRVVLNDLSKFCRADQSTAHPDSHMAARLDGRREVWLRVQAHLNLTTAEMYRLFHGQKNPGD